MKFLMMSVCNTKQLIFTYTSSRRVHATVFQKGHNVQQMFKQSRYEKIRELVFSIVCIRSPVRVRIAETLQESSLLREQKH